jgi:hypothetical protein
VTVQEDRSDPLAFGVGAALAMGGMALFLAFIASGMNLSILRRLHRDRSTPG